MKVIIDNITPYTQIYECKDCGETFDQHSKDILKKCKCGGKITKISQ